MMEKVSIIIPTFVGSMWPQLVQYLDLCLMSILLHVDSESELIVFDTGGDINLAKYLSEACGDLKSKPNLKQVKVIVHSPEFDPDSMCRPVSFSKACNKGAERSNPESDFLVFLNSDTVVGPGWLEAMVKAYHHSPHTGVVGVWSNEIGGAQSIKSQPMSQHSYYTKLIKGVCMMVRREDFFKVGGFDEEYKKWYQDDDLSMKFYSFGYHNVIAPTFVMHFGSMTFKALGIDLEKDPEIREDAERFKKKWGSYFKGLTG